MVSFLNKYILPLLILGLLCQQFVVFQLVSPVKLYMILIFFTLIFLLLNHKTLKLYSLKTFEIFWLMFLVLNLSSIYVADNLTVSLSLFIGTLVLLLMYFVYRMVFQYAMTLEAVLIKFYFWFVVFSLLFYFLGLYCFFVLNMRPVGDGYASRALYGVMFEGARPRLRGITDSPNNFGLFIIIGYSLVLFNTSVNKRRLFITLIVISVLLTMSITTIIAMLIVTMGYIIRQRKLFIISAGMITILALLIALFYNMFEDSYIISIVDERLSHLSSGSGRWELWEKTLDYISQRPFTGYGLNQSRELFVDLRGYHSTHNAILEVWLGSGIVILSIYLTFWLFLLRSTAILYFRNAKGNFLFPLSLAMFFFSMSNVTIFTEIFTFFLVIASYYISLKRNFNNREECQ